MTKSASSRSKSRSLGLELFIVAGLVALAIVLKRFDIPYPPAPFLKYDLSGVPIVVIAYMSLRYLPASLIVYYVVNIAMGSDAIGMAMKVLAELFTAVPLVLVLKRLGLTRTGISIATSAAIVVRVVSMVVFNLLVTPYWMVMAKWAKTYEQALIATYGLTPHIVVFNASLALMITVISLVALRIIVRSGFAK